MSKDIVEIYEDCQTWRRLASMWSVCHQNAKRSCFTERTWAVMPKVVGHINARCRDDHGVIGLQGSRDGWAIVTGWLSLVQWGSVVKNGGGPLFNSAERTFAGELGHRLILGSSVCDSFREG